MINLTPYVIAHYNFNAFIRGSGQTLLDSGPHGYHAYPLMYPDTGLINGGGRWDGVTDYADLPDITHIDLADELNISVWVKHRIGSITIDNYIVDRWVNSVVGQLLIYGDQATYDNWRGIVINSDGGIYASPINVNGDALITLNWQWLCLSYKRDDYFRFFVDNVLISEVATSDFPVISQSGVIRLGADRDDASLREFDGKMDELLFLSHALTPAERAWVYNGGAGREEVSELSIIPVTMYNRQQMVRS